MICEKCRQPVVPDTAEKCPHCGHTRGGYYTGVALAVIGLLLTLTLAGALIGIPMMLGGFYAMYMAQQPIVEKT